MADNLPSSHPTNKLDRISAPDVATEAGPEVQLELTKLEDERSQIENSSLKQDIAERKTYASRFFWVSCVWIIFISGILLLVGFSPWGFRLSDPVVLAAIGSTTANILGILYIVANYLFPKR